MKKITVLFVVLISVFLIGNAEAAKKRRVVKSKKTPAAETASATTASKTSVKMDDVAPSKKPKSSSFQAWLKEMKNRVNKTNSQPNQIVAVAAVRGDDTPDAPPLYWKTKKGEAKVNPPEIKEFDAAIDSALSGDTMAAKDKLQSFMIAYPNSPLVPDAKETLSRLDATLAQAPN